MSGFYNLPKFVQWTIAIILFIVGFGAMMPFLVKPYGILLLPLLAPIFNLVSVPFFRLIGYFKYLNPYVLSTVQTDKEYDLHNKRDKFVKMVLEVRSQTVRTDFCHLFKITFLSRSQSIKIKNTLIKLKLVKFLQYKQL